MAEARDPNKPVHLWVTPEGGWANRTYAVREGDLVVARFSRRSQADRFVSRREEELAPPEVPEATPPLDAPPG